MDFFKQIFIWWYGQTLGTRLFTFFKGKKVGEDEKGNIYYHNTNDTRRWVVYNGLSEPTKTPNEWYAWLHRLSDELPSSDDANKSWQLKNKPNLTGTPFAYHPDGSLNQDSKTRKKVTKSYNAWQPE